MLNVLSHSEAGRYKVFCFWMSGNLSFKIKSAPTKSLSMNHSDYIVLEK